MSDLFGKYLGKLEVEVDGDKLELDMQIQEKHKLMKLLDELRKGFSEETLNKISDLFLQILQRSYPDVPREELEAFLLKKLEAMLTGISIALGWTTKEDLEKRLEKKGLQEKG